MSMAANVGIYLLRAPKKESTHRQDTRMLCAVGDASSTGRNSIEPEQWIAEDPALGFDDGGEEGGEAIPGDLDADAEQNEGDHAQDSVGGGGRNYFCDLGSVGVAEINQHAEDNYRKKHSEMRQEIVGKILVRDVCGDGEQPHEGARPRGDGKGEGVEDAFFKMTGVRLGAFSSLFLLFASVYAGVALVQHCPTHGGDDDAAGELDDGQRDSEEIEDGRAGHLKNPEEDDVVDGDAPGERAKDRGRCVADKA